VFLLSGNATAGSHAPLTVAVFMTALSLVMLSVGTVVQRLADRLVARARILGALGVAGGFVMALVGGAFLLDRFAPIRRLLLP
jgi:hypothetical protein